MKIIRLNGQAIHNTRTVAALGNFDGVHSAHTKLLDSAVSLAKRLGASSSVFCFDPPASDYFGNGEHRHLTTLDEKLRVFEEHGIEIAFVADFPSLRDTSPEDFIKDILIARCQCVGVVCGYNFRFGKNASGDAKMLTEFFGEDNSAVTEEIKMNGITVSSTGIRRLLEIGDVKTASELLSRNYSFESTVYDGKHLGHTLGFPTANQLIPKEKLIPRHGVYASVCRINGNDYPAVSNIGIRPSVRDGAFVNCETHIIDGDFDLYGKEIRVSLCEFLRDEMRFDTLQELKAAIVRDLAHAKTYFGFPDDQK